MEITYSLWDSEYIYIVLLKRNNEKHMLYYVSVLSHMKCFK